MKIGANIAFVCKENSKWFCNLLLSYKKITRKLTLSGEEITELSALEATVKES